MQLYVESGLVSITGPIEGEGMTTPTITLEQYRALAADARAALRMIREVVEQHAPPGSVPSEEMVEPPFVREAEVLVKGILAIAAEKWSAKW